MPITYVINLARSRGRRRTVTQALRRAGVPFELVPAVDGATLPAELVARAIEPGRFYRASAAAVACALSHRDVRRAVAARGEPVAVVIEDDCLPAAGFAATVRDIAGVVDGRTVVLKSGQSYQVADGDLAHRSRTAGGAKLFIVD